MDDSLQQRLRKLGLVKGLGDLSARSERAADDGYAASLTLPGAETETAWGRFWLWTRTFAPETRHGCHLLGQLADLSDEALDLLGVPALGPRPAFIDTETTGLARGAGTLAFLVGVGVWQAEGLVLHLIFMRDPTEEAAALHYLTEVLTAATGLVTFNGRGFDVPILEARYVLNRMPPLPLTLPHLDLLTTARKLWRDHLASRRLGELERAILGVARTKQDLDSSLIPWLYRQYLETGDASEMARVFYHNEVDVLSLASLLVHVAKMVTMPSDMALAAAEWVGVGRMLDQAGRKAAALEAWRWALSGRAGELDPDCEGRVWEVLGLHHKRREAWSEALAIWDAWAAAMPGAISPLVEKAKYYEWTARNLDAALSCAEVALQRAARLPSGLQRYRTLAELQHRKARLLRRLAHDDKSADRKRADMGPQGEE